MSLNRKIIRKVIDLTAMVITVSCCAMAYAETFQELYDQGNQYYQQGQHEKAIEYLEKTIKLNPEFAPAYNLLGLAYRDTNANPREVIWYFKTAIDIDPQFLEAYDHIIKVYYSMGIFDKAEQYGKKALEINPNHGGIQFSLAWIYLLGKSQPNEAIFYFKKVLEKAKIPYAYYGLGIAYFMADDRAMVLETITMLRSLNEDKLAEQIEKMVRDYYYIPGEEGGSLVTIKPPESPPEEEIPESLLEVTAQPKLRRPDRFTTQIQLRGTVFNAGEGEDDSSTEGQESDSANQSPSLRSSSVLTSGSKKQSSVQVRSPSAQTSPPAPSKKRTIEIMGSDTNAQSHDGY